MTLAEAEAKVAESGGMRRAVKAARLSGGYRTKSIAAQRAAERRHALKQYGLTPEAFEAMWSQQAGRCGMCGKEMARPVGRSRRATGRGHRSRPRDRLGPGADP